MNFFKKIQDYEVSKNERSVRARINMLKLLVLKGYSIFLNILLVSITLDILGDYKYGIWITVFNVLTWISFFDIGIGTGLRNKLAESLSKNDTNEAREYVSTAYIIVILITICLLILFIVPWFFVNWSSVFNVPAILEGDIRTLIAVTYVFTCIQFVLNLINMLLLAMHKPAVSALISAISNTLILIVFIVSKQWLEGNLIAVGSVYVISGVFVFSIASAIMFFGKIRDIKPSISFFRKEKIPPLYNLSIKFFIIQIAVLVIYQTDSMIIAHKISIEDVTPYNILLRYFGIVNIIAVTLMTPLWSAYTDAAVKNDYAWIKKTIKEQLKLLVFLFFCVVLLCLSSSFLLEIWLQKEVRIPRGLLIAVAIYTVLLVWNNIFSSVLGGLSLVRLGTIVTTVTAILNIPLSLYFLDAFAGDSRGVIYATIACIGVTAIISPIQVYYFVYYEKKNKFLSKILR